MSDNWDAYFCEVEGSPASILVDLGMVEQAPLPGLSCMGYVAVDLKDPDENGFVRRKEYGALAALEDSLVEGIGAGRGIRPGAEGDVDPAGECSAVYVGRCISAGRCEFFFYLASTDGWERRVDAALGPLPSYPWETGAHEDPDWGVYLDFLYPSEPDLLFIQNRRLCARLRDQGDDLSKERGIEHHAGFATEEGRAAFCAAARAAGFAPEFPESAEEDPEPVFRVLLRRADSPDSIDEVTLFLAELAEEHQGAYFGWCAPVTM